MNAKAQPYPFDDMPLFQSVRRVRACRIASVERVEGGALVHAVEEFLDPVPVPVIFADQSKPVPGGVLLRYEGTGFFAWMTAADFTRDFIPIDRLTDRRETLMRQLAEVNAAIAAHQGATP